MKTQLLLLIMVLGSGLLPGQNRPTNTSYTEQDLQDLSNLNPGSGAVRSIDTRYEGVKGSPFLNEDWQKGTFELAGKTGYGEEVLVKLDLADQILYFRLNNGFTGTLPTNKVRSLQLMTDSGSPRLFRVFPEGRIEGSNSPKLRFYEVLLDDQFVLLRLPAKEFRQADYQGAYSSNKRYDEFIDQSSLWLQENGQAFQKVKLKKKAIEKALPDHSQEIQRIIKAEKLGLSDEADLVRLLRALSDQ
ncbi:hypothetical protein [Flavilitoribacter nigricans]|uniref:Uncharacterized protein n=1 Tax=Flavilitoribacter nigricans (strain ATCC 23147 / DSM 23189 / NBRC 102662 / NCIMB 1420 / SS-2) TaxID=1122177 RepID=A0A2D0NBG9_FLAN2|nr:hypothetical protein [Flavilitoribacter nigricans]PHN05736.1 hypothetical protein CRP01_14770 [Flavilitoribacter nigricans DSM 23189 = NBRC 102662]